jgi:hypothetical protein
MTETGFEQVETDIALAKNCRACVLITAAPDRALAVVDSIADGTTENRILDGAAIVDAARGDWWGDGTTRDKLVAVVREVDALSETEQAALMTLLDAREQARYRRIVATSSVCLFDRVRQGTFNPALFYRLNVLHIVSNACSDRIQALKPCCGDADGSWWGAPEDKFPPPC